MASLPDSVAEYTRQLQKGVIQQAYRGIMEYLLSLRAALQVRHPEYIVPGGLYQGYMDMSYFSFTPPTLVAKKLKVAIVYLHEQGRFEVWLAGANRQVQAQYYKKLKGLDLGPYQLVTPGAGVDAIVSHTLVMNPDFTDLDALTARLEAGVLQFIAVVEQAA